MQVNSIVTSVLSTPIGDLFIKSNGGGIISVLFDNETSDVISDDELTLICKQQLQEYFSDKREIFDLPLLFSGTDFQVRVWKQLQDISFGKTISYLQLAKNLGDAKCIRAAGTANGRNPFAIVVPCHRVISSNSSLVGYAGGLWRKQWLLNHESKQHQIVFN